MYYIYDPDDNPQGWGGTDRGGYSEAMTLAIDYKTGNIRWRHPWEGGSRAGLLATAGNVLFTGGASSDIVALNATTGDALWHARLNTSVSNGPITYDLDGLQYLRRGRGRHDLDVRAEQVRCFCTVTDQRRFIESHR